MDDDVDWPADRRIAKDPVLGDIPVIGDLGEVAVTDDDQQVEVGLIAILGLVDPIVPSVAPEQDDLVDLAVAPPRLGRARARLPELVHQHPDDPRELVLLALRKIVDAAAHGTI
jgi:hypothetical protein